MKLEELSKKFGDNLIVERKADKVVVKGKKFSIEITNYALDKLSHISADRLLDVARKKGLVKINKRTAFFYTFDFEKVVKFIKNNPGCYLREIARNLNLHPEIVRRYILRMMPFLETIDLAEGRPLPTLPKLLRFKEEVEIKNLLVEPDLLTKRQRRYKDAKYKSAALVKEREGKTSFANEIEEILAIVKFIKNNPGCYLREIARNLNLSPAVVRKRLKEISEFLKFVPLKRKLDADVNLPNLPVFIYLKDGITLSGIKRYLEIKKKLGSLYGR